MNSTDTLTAKQADVLEHIRDFYAREDRLPSTRELQQAFGWKSQTAAVSFYHALARKGLLEHRSGDRTGGWWRFARTAEPCEV